MNLSIRYEANFRYEKPVSFSPHLARIFPRTDLFVKVGRMRFETDAAGDVQFRRDLFDNLIACCFFPQSLDALPFRLELDLDVKERNPFHFLLDARGARIPCQYTGDERALLAAFLATDGTASLPGPLSGAASGPTAEALVARNSWIHKNLGYERRDEGDPFPPAETLRRGSGSCRDFAVLLAESLRQSGVAARLAAGFVWEGDKEESDRRAQSSLHAWVEAYLPGAGWIGMDPTNGVLCDHHFVTTAVGLRPADIAPISGTFYENERVAGTLATHLEIQKTDITR